MRYEDISNMLPIEAYHHGWHLTWWRPEEWSNDPVILDKHGKELYRWEYTPSLGEVFEKCQELLAEEANKW